MGNTIRRIGILVCGVVFVVGCGPGTTSKKAADALKEGASKAADAAKEGAGKAAEAAKEGVGKAAEATSTAAEAAKKAFTEQKDMFTATVTKQMGDFDKKYDDLKAKAKDATGDAKTKLDGQLKAVEEKRKLVKEHMDKLKDAGQDGWDKLEKGISGAVDDLKKTLE